MKTKYVTVKVSYDTEETWDITLQEVKELLMPCFQKNYGPQTVWLLSPVVLLFGTELLYML